MSEYYDKGFDVDAYLTSRPRYPSCIYKRILAFHDHQDRKSGRRGKLIDLGCGPGQSSWPLLEEFDQVLGIDPGENMVRLARSALVDLENKQKKKYEKVEYRVGQAEELDDVVQEGSADLVIAGTAAHWFDYDRLWPQLERITRPGATVAFWTYDIPYPRQYGTLAKKVSDSIYIDLAPLLNQPGSDIIRSLYHNLTLSQESESWKNVSLQTYPTSGPNDFIPELPPPNPIDPGSDWELMIEDVTSWAELAQAKRTNSSYLRWSRQHPDIRMEDDYVSRQVEELRKMVLQEREKGGKVSPEAKLDPDHVLVMRPMGLLLLRKA